MWAAWLAICGVIPFAGFFSKDEILWKTVSTDVVPIGWLLWIVGTIAATCTAFYMTRLVAMTFWGKEQIPRRRTSHGADTKRTTTMDARSSRACSARVSKIDVGAVGRAGDSCDRRWIRRHQHSLHRRQTRRRQAEHRQLDESNHLESGDTFIRRQSMRKRPLRQSRKQLLLITEKLNPPRTLTRKLRIPDSISLIQ